MATGTIKKVTNESTNTYCKMPDGTLLCCGWTSSWQSVASGTYKDVEFVFPKEFAGEPYIVCSLMSDSSGVDIGSITVAVYSVSRTGFTARIYNNGSTQRAPKIMYIAMYSWA